MRTLVPSNSASTTERSVAILTVALRFIPTRPPMMNSMATSVSGPVLDHFAYRGRHSHPCVFNHFTASPLVYHHSPEAQFPHIVDAGIDEFNNPLATLLAIGRS